jgi:hypothetical protein
MPGLSFSHDPVPPMAPSVQMIEVRDVESGPLLTVVAAWRKWRGIHAMPTREQLAMRDLGLATRHISLARVVDGGEDYELRIIGDAHVQAYGASNYLNRRVSEVIEAAPRFGRQLKSSYDYVRTTGRGIAFRGTLGMSTGAQFSWFETCYLPFGKQEVDHIVNAAVYLPGEVNQMESARM